jgi:hypothetical protein
LRWYDEGIGWQSAERYMKMRGDFEADIVRKSRNPHHAKIQVKFAKLIGSHVKRVQAIDSARLIDAQAVLTLW